MKRIKLNKSHGFYEFLSILVFVCFFVTNGEASRIGVNAFGDNAVQVLSLIATSS